MSASKKTGRKRTAAPTERDLEALHAAFVAPPANLSERDEDQPRRALVALARKLGVPELDAKQRAVGAYWYQERAAAYVRVWAAKHYPGAPLDLEGFAAAYAGSRRGDRVALAWGRELWYRALAPLAHWEELRVILEDKRRVQAERDAAARRAA